MLFPAAPLARGKGTSSVNFRLGGGLVPGCAPGSLVVRPGDRSRTKAFMPNTTEESSTATDWVSTLQRLETLGSELRQPGDALPLDRREPKEIEFIDLQSALPAGVLLAVRARINRGERLVASAYGARCGACHVAMPRGDHVAVLVGEKIVPCQCCGVLLHADDAERSRVAALREVRAKTNSRRARS